MAEIRSQYNSKYYKTYMDFMNLNQSAHGDREFGFMTARMHKKRKIMDFCI